MIEANLSRSPKSHPPPPLPHPSTPPPPHTPILPGTPSGPALPKCGSDLVGCCEVNAPTAPTVSSSLPNCSCRIVSATNSSLVSVGAELESVACAALLLMPSSVSSPVASPVAVSISSIGQSRVTCPPSGIRSTSRWYVIFKSDLNNETTMVHACLFRNASTASYCFEK